MIVNVQFKKDYNNMFSGRKFSYLCMMDVKVGDIVKLPTVNGERIGKIVEIDVSPARVNPRILPVLKCITEYAEVKTNG